ncbi:MAG: hypothetical protein F4137_14485 [Acidobacteria bacterium]|nr:hypothetical protein [Acidobacteriota bacterium]
MKRLLHFLFAAAVALAMLPVDTQAHFQLVEPAPWINLDRLGNPQKVGPCGGNPTGDNDAILSGIVTEVTGGSKLHLKIQETIFHSGHYRVALSVNSRNELPADPTAVEKWTDRGLYSVWGVIQSPPQIPVIADGLFPHYPVGDQRASFRPETPMDPWEADIAIPNINCEKCTLQVIQFMADHVYNTPGGYSYHHCADLKITADPSKPIDDRWPGQMMTNDRPEVVARTLAPGLEPVWSPAPAVRTLSSQVIEKRRSGPVGLVGLLRWTQWPTLPLRCTWRRLCSAGAIPFPELLSRPTRRERPRQAAVRAVRQHRLEFGLGQYRPIASKSISMVGSDSWAENLMNPISASLVSSR